MEKMVRDSRVVVVGLGYVGLPLALRAASKGFEVTGLDINSEKIRSLQEGRSYIDGITDAAVRRSAVTFTAEADCVESATMCVICVPTPLIDETQLPDLGPVRGAVSLIAPYLKRGTLVVL